MNREQLQRIFRQPYNADLWQTLLIELFGADKMRRIPRQLTNDSNEKVEGFELGLINTTDNYVIGLYAFEIKQGTNLKLNRVGLRSLVKGYTKFEVDAALAVYFDRSHWRLSFICDLNSDKTDAKRYTYAFGNLNESYKTASSMLAKIAETQHPSFKEIKAAFSVEALSKKFFDGYKAQYTKFCNHLGGSEKWQRDYVKKMLGRLVFLQFLQKKGWMGVPAQRTDWQGGDLLYIQNLIKRNEDNDQLLSEVLKPLFFDTLNTQRPEHIAHPILGDQIKIPYLNGGLFDKDTLDERTIDFPYSYFAELADFFAQYNFTIDENDPNDAEVGIDPEMLGHIFENLLEDNKDKGAFYTPKEIVQYMCRQSLIEYLQSKLGKHPEIEAFINTHDTGNRLDGKNFIAANAKVIEKLLDNVKICDPAIGSGAFPMGILHEIFHAKMTLDLTLDRAEVKRSIIQNSIYGVDIEQGAVDIARLRFWLSLVVDEEVPQPLPNLDFKIMQGNSLLERFEGIDLSRISTTSIDVKMVESSRDLFGNLIDNQLKISFESSKELSALQDNLRRYFSVKDPELKQELRGRIDSAVYQIIENCIERYESNKIRLHNEMIGSLSTRQQNAKSKLEQEIQQCTSIREKLRLIEQTNEKPFFLWKVFFGDIFSKGGFDIMIANPPYVSTKGVSDEDKKSLIEQFGFADDLYYHFIVRGFGLLKPNGVMTMITPDTYFTTLTKKNLRKLLLENTLLSLVHLGHDVFEEAMVSTAIFVTQKKPYQSEQLQVLDARGKKKLSEAAYFEYSQEEYAHSINGSFFVPNTQNLNLHASLASIHNTLINQYWDKIDTSREISRNEAELEKYRAGLKSGDWTLVGLVTEGGQGLATANNGRFVGVREGTKEAIRIKQTRILKLAEANRKCRTNFEMPEAEQEVWTLFEEMKTQYGRDIFGQGYLYKIVPNELIADVEAMTNEEKQKGINNSPTFVPYDKGDKDGNRWYLESPYLIDWSVENVHFLKSNSGKKGEGMPVVRNSQFYFREGFCWNNNLNENNCDIKCKLKQKGVPDVASMSLYSLYDKTPDFYIVCMINSRVCGEIYRRFLNATVNVQMNDIKALPIPVPTAEQLSVFKIQFDKAVAIQQDFFRGTITSAARETALSTLQSQIDEMVCQLYGLTYDEIFTIYPKTTSSKQQYAQL